MASALTDVGLIAARAHALMAATTDLVWFADVDGRVVSANAAAEALLGWNLALETPSAAAAFTVASRAVIEVDAAPRLTATSSWSGDLSMRGADGEVIPVSVVMVRGQDPGGGPSWVATIARDLRKARRLEQHARYQATHDSLTGLANRDGLEAAASVAIAQRGAAVLLCDLDHLKLVNDTVGYDAGDAVLVEVAARLRACLRDEDLAARISGDEFAILLPGASLDDAAAVATRIADHLEPPHIVDARQLRVTASIGIAHTGPGELPLGRLLQNADLAMYVAKQGQTGGFETYDADLHRRLIERSQLRNDLGEALERRQLHLLYQPIVTLADGRVRSVEALLRWHHPELGVVGPDLFIPLLEETGWIVPVGAWIIDEALGQVARWQVEHPDAPALDVNVNVSALQLTSDLVGVVTDALARHDVAPARLVVEITETALASDVDRAAGILTELRAIGVRTALDDFGTGYSSLSSLQSLPIDHLKIDRSFVQAMTATGDTTLAAGICELAARLGMRTVAEGIELASEAAQMLALGCDVGQGFLWSRPLPAPDAIAFAVQRSDTTSWSDPPS